MFCIELLMAWGMEKIANHIRAAELLQKVKDDAFGFLKKGRSEYETMQFIFKRFKRYGLRTDRKVQIVAFNENSAVPHYYPKRDSKTLEKNSLVLIDIWARLDKKNSPFADITWLGYFGKKIPKAVLKMFKTAIMARDAALDRIREGLSKGRMVTGREADRAARKVILHASYKNCIKHSTGHSLGFSSVHGIYKGMRRKNKKHLLRNIAYAIEPGIYVKKKFGMRSEINCFVNEKDEIVLTTELQKDIIRI
jgi:Xaa-Pro dipeptidase